MIARIAIILTFLVAPAMAQIKLDAGTREALAWQIALEREGFSPGIIDGKCGAKFALAKAEFAGRVGLNESAIAAPLGIGQREPVQSYSVRAEDVASVVGTIPTDWNLKAKMQFLGYPSVADAVAERFHCTRGLLDRLNPGTNMTLLKQGDVLMVPAIEKAKVIRGSKLQINLEQKVIRVFDREGKVAALFHCSIAKDEAKRPTGIARVVSVAVNPTYQFDPAMWPEVKNVSQKLIIPPGPRNPVGICWITLSLSGYGIHGTPTPEMIGKTGSHGCFRLTNWDASRLGGIVEAGMAVEFVGR